MTHFLEIVKHNLLQKLVAIFVAIILWFVVMNEQNPLVESTVKIPLTIVNRPENYHISENYDSVNVKIRGQRSAFISLPKDEFSAVANLAEFSEGLNKIPVKVMLPAGFELLETTPDKVDFNIEALGERKVPVEILTTGKLKKGFAISKMTTEFSEVIVRGTRSRLHEVSRVLGYVKLKDNVDNIITTVTLLPVDEHDIEISELEVLPASTVVNVTLKKAILKKTVPIKVDILDDTQEDGTSKKLRVTPSAIEIQGETDVVEKITEVSTEKIDLAKLNGGNTLKTHVKLPLGVSTKTSEILLEIENSEKDEKK